MLLNSKQIYLLAKLVAEYEDDYTNLTSVMLSVGSRGDLWVSIEGKQGHDCISTMGNLLN